MIDNHIKSELIHQNTLRFENILFFPLIDFDSS